MHACLRAGAPEAGQQHEQVVGCDDIVVVEVSEAHVAAAARFGAREAVDADRAVVPERDVRNDA